jgi:hypothetical protein
MRIISFIEYPSLIRAFPSGSFFNEAKSSACLKSSDDDVPDF